MDKSISSKSISSSSIKNQGDSKKMGPLTVHRLKVSPNQITDVRIGIRRLWNIVPLFIKFITLSIFIICILNLFFPSISYYLANIPYYTFFHIQLWRLFSSPFITTNIINYFLGIIFWIREGSSIETRLGTIKYIIIFIRNTFFIELLYSCIIYIVSLIIKKKNFMMAKINEKEVVNNCGFWPIIMSELTLLCICNPNIKVKFLFIPYEFSAKYYPIIWFLVFCIFNTYNNDIEVLIGILYSFIYQYLLRYYINISDSFIQKIENHFCCSWMLKITGFVSVSHITNKFMDEKLNKRITGQILNLNKASSRKKTTEGNIERTVKITSEYTNRSENSIISNASPTSIFDTSFGGNKPNLP
jgi:membrane associated rhomboid family serine protease